MTPPETQRRKLVVLLVAGGSLTAAFVAGPELLLASRCPGSCDPQALGSALAPALAGFVEQSSPSPAEGLVQLVDLWLWWHATKVVISALLLVVCALLGVEVWRRHASAGRRASGWWALTGIVVMVVSVLVVGLFALNVQATAVPLVALLPLLAKGPDAVGAAAGQVRAAVTNSTETSVSAPVRVLVDSVAHYDWTMAGVAGALAVVAAASAMLAMRQRRRCTPIQRRTRVRSSASGVVAAFAVVLFGGVCAGSVVAALDPLSSLQGLLGVG